MASKATESTPEKRLIATYLPGTGIKGLKRVITKKDFAARSIEVDGDFVWEADNGHRLDITGAPDALLEVLKSDTDIQINEE